MKLEDFPPINASLNGASAVLLCLAFFFIKTRRIRAHAYTMIAAVIVSVAFLACYISYHVMRIRGGVVLTKFPAGRLRPVYLAVLASHSLLAAVVPPLVIVALFFAWRRNWRRHRAVAIPTFCIWLYVSITGVVVYWMLYQM